MYPATSEAPRFRGSPRSQASPDRLRPFACWTPAGSESVRTSHCSARPAGTKRSSSPWGRASCGTCRHQLRVAAGNTGEATALGLNGRAQLDKGGWRAEVSPVLRSEAWQVLSLCGNRESVTSLTCLPVGLPFCDLLTRQGKCRQSGYHGVRHPARHRRANS